MQVKVTQQELQEIYDLEQDVAPKLKRIEELKSNVKALLIHRMEVELGRFDAQLIKHFNRHVPWRVCVVDNLGLEFAENYKKLFKPRMFCDVMVVEHAVLPLWKHGGNSDPGVGGDGSNN
jgi:hypothetical protein